MGSSGSLRNNLRRSFGAHNFAVFWNYWNPIFGYFLGKFIFKPLKKLLPIALSLVLTFVFCGLVHDAVTVLFRGGTSFFFTGWFLLMSLAVLLSKYFPYDASKQAWLVRAIINISIIATCYALTIYLTKILANL